MAKMMYERKPLWIRPPDALPAQQRCARMRITRVREEGVAVYSLTFEHTRTSMLERTRTHTSLCLRVSNSSPRRTGFSLRHENGKNKRRRGRGKKERLLCAGLTTPRGAGRAALHICVSIERGSINVALNGRHESIRPRQRKTPDSSRSALSLFRGCIPSLSLSFFSCVCACVRACLLASATYATPLLCWSTFFLLATPFHLRRGPGGHARSCGNPLATAAACQCERRLKGSRWAV